MSNDPRDWTDVEVVASWVCRACDADATQHVTATVAPRDRDVQVDVKCPRCERPDQIWVEL